MHMHKHTLNPPEQKTSWTIHLVQWERENGSGGQPAEPPPEVSAAPDWLDPAAQSHTQTHTHTRTHTHTHTHTK